MNAQEIAEKNCILRGVVGSTLHGVSLPGTDDRDEMGVCLEPPECVVGLRHFEQWVHRTQPEGVRSGPGDEDVTVYSLRKWCRLALGGNPTILLLLFVPPEFLMENRAPGRRLQQLAPAFIAKTVANPFLGYMTAQQQRLVGERGQMRVKRPELVAAHGYDTKYAMHMLRLGLQGRELLRSGRLTLPMTADDGAYLMAVRRGERDLNAILTRAGELRQEIEDLAKTSALPDRPDAEAVDEFLVQTYADWWGGECPAFRVRVPGLVEKA
jgi:predicted nucleotidyltransferase